MVKPPPEATVVQVGSVYQVTVPVELEAAVKACPALVTITGLPKESWNWTVITPPAPEHTPAVKVRAGVVKARRFPEEGVMLNVLEVAPVNAPEAAVRV